MAQHWSKDELKDRNVGASVNGWVLHGPYSEKSAPRADQDELSVYYSATSSSVCVFPALGSTHLTEPHLDDATVIQ